MTITIQIQKSNKVRSSYLAISQITNIAKPKKKKYQEITVGMSSSRGSWFDVEDENEKLEINGKVLKFRNKTCRDCGKRAFIYICLMQILRSYTINAIITAVISSNGGNQVCTSMK